MIDLATEKLKTLSAARRLPWMLGRTGNQISLDALNRWRLRGLRGVMLETVRIGGTIYTSEEATLRFVHRLNPEITPVSDNNATQRQQLAKADRLLDEAKIK